MTILITGGTGLVGSRLLRRFVDAGMDCRALVRPGKEVPAGSTPVEGDLLDADTLKQAVEGVSAIVHLAAVFRTQNEDDIWRANLDGTKNLITAAKATLHRLASSWQAPDWSTMRTHPIPASKITRPIPSSRIRQARSPRRTNSAIADSTGVSSVFAGAVELALTGAMDGHIVNICDDAPTTLYEMASLVGSPIEQSAEPLTDPWMGRMDGSRLRSLGFQPKVPTLYQAAQQGIL
jgi:UDP-glucose 4-epimerase